MKDYRDLGKSYAEQGRTLDSLLAYLVNASTNARENASRAYCDALYGPVSLLPKKGGI